MTGLSGLPHIPQSRRTRAWRRLLGWCLFSIVALSVSSCDDSKTKAAEAALKERETKLAEREQAAVEKEKQINADVAEKLKSIKERSEEIETGRRNVDAASQQVEKQKAD